MATDAQGRQLSDDGYYYWDGSAWQPVDQSGASGGTSSGSSQQPQNVDAQGRPLSDDGNYYWDGSQWQPVDQSSAQSSSAQSPGQSTANLAQINPEEFPSIGRVLYFGGDVDAYLQDLGIDTSELQNDDPPAVA